MNSSCVSLKAGIIRIYHHTQIKFLFFFLFFLFFCLFLRQCLSLYLCSTKIVSLHDPGLLSDFCHESSELLQIILNTLLLYSTNREISMKIQPCQRSKRMGMWVKGIMLIGAESLVCVVLDLFIVHFFSNCRWL